MKANPELVHMIVTVRKKNKKDSEKYYITSYRENSTESQENFEENFKVPRHVHGNALKPTAASYYRIDKKVLEQAAASLKKTKAALQSMKTYHHHLLKVVHSAILSKCKISCKQ